MPSICTKPLTAGDVIFEYKPLIHVLNLEFKAKFCDNCIERSNQLKRCSKCLQMYYCDKNCQTMDWKYHKNECKVFRNQLFSLNRCSLEERVILRLWLCVQSDETFATKRHQLFDGSDVSLNDIKEKVRNLSRERFMYPFEVISQKFRQYGLKFDSNELILWFAVYDDIGLMKIVSFDKALIDIQIGSGLYFQSKNISHSCIPNLAVVNPKGLLLQLRAMKSIGFGEELTVSYVDLSKNKTRRQMELKSQFELNCKCDKCVKNLDSGVDYELIGYFNQQLRQSNPIINPKAMFELMSKVMSFDNIVYGQYHPHKTIRLFRSLKYFLDNNYPNREFIIQLKDRIEDSFRVTHGESHSLTALFKQLFPSNQNN